MTKASWLGTKARWQLVRFDDNTDGRAALIFFRRQRLPWVSDKKYLLAAINSSDHSLRLYKMDTMPAEPLPAYSALLTLNSTSNLLTKLEQFFDWPMVEAVYSGYTRMDLTENIQANWIAEATMERWRVAPIAGWWPVHRGGLGLSFLRDAVDVRDNTSCCIEVTPTKIRIYQGPIAENEALADQRIIKLWNLHDLDVIRLHQILGPDDLVKVRQISRQWRYWLYQSVLEMEKLPF